VKKLAIKDLAEQTGIAAGTLRMWEQRYGFPRPSRTPSGYRVYTEQDVVALKRVLAYRERGLSVQAALERAQTLAGTTDRSSIYAALASGDSPVRPQRLRRDTLIGMSRAMEEEAIARAAGPIIIGAFQTEDNYRRVERRYQRMARMADAVGVFAGFGETRIGAEDEPAEISVSVADSLGHEWAVVIDAPGYAACLSAWESPDEQGEDRVFEALWTMDPVVVRRAAQVSATIAAREAPDWAERVLELLAERPLAVETPAPALTALTNRMVAYLDGVKAAENGRRSA
jgi:MerR family transcriptional regulator, light-induced transcriptional regulator